MSTAQTQPPEKREANTEPVQGKSHGDENALGQPESGSPYMEQDGVTYPRSELLQRAGHVEGAGQPPSGNAKRDWRENTADTEQEDN
jgi:hypothetical protein